MHAHDWTCWTNCGNLCLRIDTCECSYSGKMPPRPVKCMDRFIMIILQETLAADPVAALRVVCASSSFSIRSCALTWRPPGGQQSLRRQRNNAQALEPPRVPAVGRRTSRERSCPNPLESRAVHRQQFSLLRYLLAASRPRSLLGRCYLYSASWGLLQLQREATTFKLRITHVAGAGAFRVNLGVLRASGQQVPVRHTSTAHTSTAC
jgi:hypothetical protein